MDQADTIWIGAVAYDPKVVTIWEGMRSYLRDEANLPVEIVLFQSYGAQVRALLAPAGELAPRIDIAWNTNLAYLQSIEWSGGRCTPLAMRDTDLGWMTKIVTPTGGPIRTLDDLRGRVLALGSRDSGHAAILPVHFLAELGLAEGRDYQTLRFDTDLGKHGDTGTSEIHVLRAVLEGKADAGAIGSPAWSGVQAQALVPAGSLTEVWTSPPYSHCMFTARPGLDEGIGRRFAAALSKMSFDDPRHRPVLEAEGLKRWLPADVSGYDSLREASRTQGFFQRSA
ncbi:MAG TPA: phosphate/phosphite/phosphonate ABC transporter substrate-binding protein [Candidatus Binatia bacterium]|nr:phosphate/phosphite/phosphonate ABC transporter substrate-binding protein [Candidatus Binatia bacterium]